MTEADAMLIVSAIDSLKAMEFALGCCLVFALGWIAGGQR